MTERALLAHLAARFDSRAAWVDLGIGDDAAVMTIAGPSVWSIDAAIEGTHFRREWISPEELGEKCVVAALSDLTAMGARPRAILLSLVLPAADAWFEGIVEGARSAAIASGAPIVGGNLARGDALGITTSVVGECARPIRRRGARAGDGLFVTGPLGGARAGLLALQRSATDPRLAPAKARWRRPPLKTSLADRIAEVASAAIDLSDGLASDLASLCAASGVGARVELARVPLDPWANDAGAALSAAAIDLAAEGGEDYEVLFASAAEVGPELGTRIGEVRAGEVELIDATGKRRAAAAAFEHFP